MFKKKRIKKAEQDQKLLTDITRLKTELATTRKIIEQSVDPSDKGLFDLSVLEAKYYYLLREARNRNVRAQY